LRAIEIGPIAAPKVLPPPEVRVRVPVKQPIYRQWWSWAAVSGVFAVSGIGFTVARADAKSDLDAILADDRDHFFSEARDAENRVNRYTAIAVVSYGFTAATAIAGAVFVLTAPDRSEVRVAPLPVRGGAALAMEVAF
jgi:hypothetical protein